MTVGELTAIIAGLLAFLLGVAAFFFRRRAAAHRSFIAGMFVLGAEAIFSSLALGALSPPELIQWSRWKLIASALVPGTWLIFSLTCGRGNSVEFLRKWRPVWLLFLVAPPLAVALQWPALVQEAQMTAREGPWFVQLGWLGRGLALALVAVSILILMNLERTFRAALGTQRWRLKYLVLGIGLLFGVRVYTATQALLFWGYSASLVLLESMALILACVCVGYSLLRSKAAGVEVYPSRAVLHHSVTGLLAGIYLLVVGVFFEVVTALGDHTAFQLKSFLILVGIVGLAVVLLSDLLRQRVLAFIARHFRRPSYDYRSIWLQFTARTSALDEAGVCREVVRLVSETFRLYSTSVWLVDEHQGHLACAASTILTGAQADEVSAVPLDVKALSAWMAEKARPVDLEEAEQTHARELAGLTPVFLRKGGHRMVVPLFSGGELLGLLCVADRAGGQVLTPEDVDLLKCIADQAAASLRNARMSRSLAQAKEVEAFQSISAFVVHDLKNTASALSLMVQNMSAHFDKPRFREDAIRDITKSAGHITDLVSRLNVLRQKLEVHKVPCDLNAFIQSQLAGIEGSFDVPVIRELKPLPQVPLDPDLFSKVLTNLLLNARDALDGQGEIRIGTSAVGGWASLTVSDNGCGMSPDFIRDSLFRPFQSTKKNGFGIGMFHSRMIVEAHGGRIEVQSQPGQGTTFKIFLPLPELKP